MKFLANENLEKRIVKHLRELGHDVKYFSEIKPRSKDEEVIELANMETRIILTNDKDFGELCFLQQKAKTGILLFRFDNENITLKISVLDKVISEFGTKLINHFTVVSENKIRIRPFLSLLS
ncbi:MAG: DUF5615 family PIN-like protein [Elusimicrobiota bacterium]